MSRIMLAFVLGVITGVMLVASTTLVVDKSSESVELYSEFKACNKDYKCMCELHESKKLQDNGDK